MVTMVVSMMMVVAMEMVGMVVVGGGWWRDIQKPLDKARGKTELIPHFPLDA